MGPVDPRLPPFLGQLNTSPYPNLGPPGMGPAYGPYYPQYPRTSTQWSMTAAQLQHPVTMPHYPFGTPNGNPSQADQPQPESGGRIKRAAAELADMRLKKVQRLERATSGTPTPDSETVESEEEEDNEELGSTPIVPDTQSVVVDGDRVTCPNMLLKGTRWPGMHCFDAAPPHQRSQRNQKKTIESYLALEASSVRVSTEPFEVIFKFEHDQDQLWDLVKSRVITGHPSPSSIASSSPTRQSPSRRALRQRFAREDSTATNGDEDNDRELHRAVFGIRRGKIPVLRQDDYADETASINTFAGRSRTRKRIDVGPGHRLNQENERTDSLSAHATAKTDFEGTESSTHVALPSIERTAEFHRDMGFDDAFMAPLRQSTALPQPSPFLQSSPHAPFLSNSYGNGPWPRYISGSQAMSNSLGQQHNMHPQAWNLGNQNPFSNNTVHRQATGLGGLQNGAPGSNANARLDNLATVASDFNNQMSMFDNSLAQLSPSHSNQFFPYQLSPGYGGSASALQAPEWLRASPGQQSGGFHARNSSHSWHMPAPVPLVNRPFGFFDAQDPMHQSSIGQYRLTSNQQFSGFGGYGLTGGPDSKLEHAGTSLPPVNLSAPVTANTPVPGAADEPVTPTARLMPPPPLPESSRLPRPQAMLDPSAPGLEDGHVQAIAEADQDLDGTCSSNGSEPSLPQVADAATTTGAAEALEGVARHVSTDEDRTVTAPGTPAPQA